MKNIFIIAVFVFCILSCKTTKEAFVGKPDKQEVVVISNDSIEYGVIIMDPGFESFLVSIAKPKWYYSEQYYKNKNIFYVTQWNMRVQDPFQYSASIYEQSIDYDPSIDYGLEVNYKLYNYFKFVEYKYKVKFF